MAIITIESMREGYSAGQVADGTMTVSELIDCLQEMADAYGDDTKVVCSNDHGYTYGSIGYDEVGVIE